jgi:hypothetical protein
MIRALTFFILTSWASAFAPAPVVARYSAMRTLCLEMVSVSNGDWVFNQNVPEELRKYFSELEKQLLTEKLKSSEATRDLEKELLTEKLKSSEQLLTEKLKSSEQLLTEKLKSSEATRELEKELLTEKLKSSEATRELEKELSEVTTSLKNYVTSSSLMGPRAIIGAFLFV